MARVSAFAAALLAGTGFVGANDANAQTADDVLNKMTPEQGSSYLAGIVEGLAQARWQRDRPDETGFKCIYDWYYSDTETIHNRVTQWFGRHPDKAAGALMYVLVKQECGE